jgi:hypothetical protein
VKFSHILVVTLLGCSSCEKVRSLLGKGGEKPPAAAEAKAAVVAAKPYTGAAASEISASDIEGFRQQAGKPKCTAEKHADVETPKVAEPLTRPMPKDWMPEGMKRR